MGFGQGVEVGGKAAGFGITVAAALAFVRWLMTFIAQRQDVRHEKLNEQEARLAKSLGDRLRHLEEREAGNLARIGALEECVSILLLEVRTLDPGNPKLVAVAKLLARSIPLPPDMAESLEKIQ